MTYLRGTDILNLRSGGILKDKTAVQCLILALANPPLIQLRGLGERCKLPCYNFVNAGRQTVIVHFVLNMFTF